MFANGDAATKHKAQNVLRLSYRVERNSKWAADKFT